MRKLFILLFFSASSLLMAQNTNPIQEAMANYDYETALTLQAEKIKKSRILAEMISIILIVHATLLVA